MKRGILLVVLLALLITVAIAYAVEISVSAVNQLGATPQVKVSCPASECTISRVSWILTTSLPYNVDKVRVHWKPADTSKTYNVCVELYQSTSGNPISSGCQSASGSFTYTEVDVTNVDPRQVYYVRIVIVETTS
ncbi:MAG: hypothetical protein N3G77_06085 [Nitrososphaeria archaeon]|nr:hypothetical protein [Nitrososphaeria archaeon]